MASASKTPNLNLPQWVGTEKPERTDFNAAFDAIDNAATRLVKEFGSNSNGSWVKFTNNLAICYFMKTITIDLAANTDYQVNELSFPLTLSEISPMYCVTTPYLYRSGSTAVFETQYKMISTTYAGRGNSWGWLKCWHNNTSFNADVLRLYCLMIGMVT